VGKVNYPDTYAIHTTGAHEEDLGSGRLSSPTGRMVLATMYSSILGLTHSAPASTSPVYENG